LRRPHLNCRPRPDAGYWEQQLPTLFGKGKVSEDVREVFCFADVTGYKGPTPAETEAAKERIQAYMRDKRLGL
jgi:hypothetical protein